MAFTLPSLPYAYNALEPHIDAKTMEIHHTKHHQAYIDKANGILAGTAWESWPVEDVVAKINEFPDAAKKQALKNNAGGHLNHSFFWQIMGPNAGGEPSGALMDAITAAFGSFADFQTKFSDAGVNRFGSGWAWLVVSGGALEIISTANQNSPVTDGKTPILGLDVWEHAYYLNYQNKRADYIKAWWNVIHWTEVEKRFATAA